MRSLRAALLAGLVAGAPGTSAWAYCALPSASDFWIEIANPGNALLLGDDDALTFFWPPTFTMFGSTYNYVTIGSNGLVVPQLAAPFPAPPPPNAPGATDPNNVAMPNPLQPNPVVAPYWDDLNPAFGGTVYAAGVGIAMLPQRLVVEWQNVPNAAGTGAGTFQAQLEVGTGEVVFCYQDVDFGNPAFSFGASATVGIEDEFGGGAEQYSFNTASLTNGSCIRFHQVCPCPDADGDGYSPSGGACGAVDCDDGNAAVNPGAAEIVANGLDDDCNAATPDCPDADGDGYSAAGGVCGAVDCDDGNAAVNPGAAEIPLNGVDDDCDGVVCGSIPGDGSPAGAGALLASAFGVLAAAARRRRRA